MRLLKLVCKLEPLAFLCWPPNPLNTMLKYDSADTAAAVDRQNTIGDTGRYARLKLILEAVNGV